MDLLIDGDHIQYYHMNTVSSIQLGQLFLQALTILVLEYG